MLVLQILCPGHTHTLSFIHLSPRLVHPTWYCGKSHSNLKLVFSHNSDSTTTNVRSVSLSACQSTKPQNSIKSLFAPNNNHHHHIHQHTYTITYTNTHKITHNICELSISCVAPVNIYKNPSTPSPRQKCHLQSSAKLCPKINVSLKIFPKNLIEKLVPPTNNLAKVTLCCKIFTSDQCVFELEIFKAK